MKYFIDLDDTLVNSTELNNDAYNFALEMHGNNRIITNNRITRETLVNIENINDIISLKQKYFTSAWLPYRLILNIELIEKLKLFNYKNCYLWTKADSTRVNKILKYCNISHYFKDIIFDKKENFEISVKHLKTSFHENKIIIYENNHDFFKNKKCEIIDTIQNKYFNVRGYLV